MARLRKAGSGAGTATAGDLVTSSSHGWTMTALPID
jgi:hypothetical protein